MMYFVLKSFASGLYVQSVSPFDFVYYTDDLYAAYFFEDNVARDLVKKNKGAFEMVPVTSSMIRTMLSSVSLQNHAVDRERNEESARHLEVLNELKDKKDLLSFYRARIAKFGRDLYPSEFQEEGVSLDANQDSYFYFVDIGILLTEQDESFSEYNNVYDHQYGYRSTGGYYLPDKEKALLDAKAFVQDNGCSYYAVVSRTINANTDIKDETERTISSVMYCVANIGDRIVENFLEDHIVTKEITKEITKENKINEEE